MTTINKIISATLTGTEYKASDIAGFYAEVINRSGGDIYVSANPGIIPGNSGVMQISSGCTGIISFPYNSHDLYLLGDGLAVIIGTDHMPLANDVYMPNLLINPDFRNPVNQRGLSEYASAGYTIDRWRLSSNGNLKINEGSITVASTNNSPTYFLQALEDYNMLDGMDVTLTVCDENNNVYTATGKVPTGTVAQTTAIVKVPFGVCQFILWKRSDGELLAQAHIPAEKSVTIKWVKLEAINKATRFSPPDYGMELAKCQRYYQLRSTGNIKAADLRPSMRTSPTITAVGDLFAYNAEI